MALETSLQKKVSIDITPLVDVVFLLLIFFMVTSTFLELPGIKLLLPSAKSSAPQAVNEVTIMVTADDNLYLNDRPITWESINTELKSALDSSPSKTIVIKADRSIPHGKVVTIMDTARLSGAQRLVVTTQLSDE